MMALPFCPVSLRSAVNLSVNNFQHIAVKHNPTASKKSQVLRGRNNIGRPETSPATTSKSAIWRTPAGLSILILILSTVTYYIGVVYHDTRLAAYGIDWKMFRVDRLDYIYFGIAATLSVLTNGLVAFGKEWTFLVILMLFGIGIALLVLAIDYLSSKSEALRNGATKIFGSKAKSIAFIVACATMFPMLMFGPIFLLSLGLVVPAALGDSAAMRQVAEERAAMAEGCPGQRSRVRCIELVEGGRTLTTGFALEINKERVAIHDGLATSLWSMNGRELIGARPLAIKAMKQKIAEQREESGQPK